MCKPKLLKACRWLHSEKTICLRNHLKLGIQLILRDPNLFLYLSIYNSIPGNSQIGLGTLQGPVILLHVSLLVTIVTIFPQIATILIANIINVFLLYNNILHTIYDLLLLASFFLLCIMFTKFTYFFSCEVIMFFLLIHSIQLWEYATFY